MEKIDYFSAQKFVSEEIEGEFERRLFHVVKTDLPIKLIMDLYEENYEADWESCYFSWGMYGDYDGDLNSIDVDRFLESCKEKFKEIQEEDEDYKDEYIEDWEKLIKGLGELKEHTLYPKKCVKTVGGKNE